jgi:hypothetical protein
MGEEATVVPGAVATTKGLLVTFSTVSTVGVLTALKYLL